MVAFGAQKTRTNTLKSRRTQTESLFGADFGPEARLGHFSSKMTKERPLQSIVAKRFPFGVFSFRKRKKSAQPTPVNTGVVAWF